MFQKNFTPKKYWNKYEVFDKVVALLTLAQLTKKPLPIHWHIASSNLIYWFL